MISEQVDIKMNLQITQFFSLQSTMYLDNGEFQVVHEGICSSIDTILSGVPQESDLRYELFTTNISITEDDFIATYDEDILIM